MLSLFKNNTPLSFLLLLLYAMLFYAAYVLAEPRSLAWAADTGRLWEKLQQQLAWSLATWRLASWLLLLLGGIVLNLINNRYRLTRRNSFLASFCWLLLSATLPGVLDQPALLLALLLVMLSFLEGFELYNKSSHAVQLFNLGLWPALAALCFPGFQLLFVWSLLVVLLLRPFQLQDVLIVLLGYLTPFFLAGTYFFWIEELQLWWQQDFLVPWRSWKLLEIADWRNWISVGLWGLLWVMMLLNAESFRFKTTMQTQKYINLLFWWFPIAGFCLLAVPSIHFLYLLLWLPALSLLLTQLFFSIKNLGIAEFLHLLIVLIAIFVQYAAFLFSV